MVFLDIDMGYGLMIWEMTVSIGSSGGTIWDILSLWAVPRRYAPAPRSSGCRRLASRPPSSRACHISISISFYTRV
jgi:hypothetical protein